MNMRINGFSGMDIDSMVKSLMTVKRVPLDKLNQQKQILDWTRDSYRQLNSKIVQLSNKLQQMDLSAATNTQKSTVSGNTTAVRAEANADAASVTMTVEVKTLAKKANLQTQTVLTTGTPDAKASLNTTLAQLDQTGPPKAEYELHINDKSLVFKDTDSLSTVISRINSEIPTANASYDEISGKLTITSRENGKVITGTGTGGAAMSSSLSDVLGLKANGAVPGSVTITTSSGVSRDYTTTGDTLLVNGVNLTLLETNVGSPSKVSTQSDPTKAMETIKSFVDTYNELLGLMNTRLSEEKYRDYAPLTAEQKKDMKEDDIKNWEERAKSGLLKNDTILSSAVASMRSVITGNLKVLSEAGITTGQYYEKGKLQIDEVKLKSALDSNPDRILSAFRGPSADANNPAIFSGLRKELNSTLDMLVKKVGTSKSDTDASMTLKTESSMGQQLKNYNNRISDLDRKMVTWETRYYKQFAAMEKAMSQFQSQSSSLSSYFQ
ncbi:flagellar filament capping protein FliD [Paenibacillus xylanexedens]|uniref:Flagellar hook-associated protein 2 n=1 Tax=Paenibacillus xylanexedens TaxID=528191 RepID=A0ABS4S2J2_PAEXY|nr:flagellar filament capping protein FliD [Paenibacillus xylanexedens]MBP2249357.1 flagellar hook-associated protein 2 [Paenibacillus xylanexedens]